MHGVYTKQNIVSVVDGAQQEVCRDIMGIITQRKQRIKIKDSHSMKSTRPPRTSPHHSGSDKEVLGLFTRPNSEMAQPLLSNVPKRSLENYMVLFLVGDLRTNSHHYYLMDIAEFTRRPSRCRVYE